MYIKKHKGLIALFALCVIIYKVIENYSVFFGWLKVILSILKPIFWGIGISYVLNPLMMFIEMKYPKLKRYASMLIVYSIFIFIVTILFTTIMPVIIKSIMDLSDHIPEFYNKTYNYIDNFMQKKSFLNDLGLNELLEKNGNNVLKVLLSVSNMTISSILNFALNFAKELFKIVLGVFVSVYLLYDKEKFIKYTQRNIYAFMKSSYFEEIHSYLQEVNKVFKNFLIGKFIDSLIIGIICFVGFRLMKVKYDILLSTIVGITNMIPYFGPFIGAVPAIVITIFYRPIQAFWVAVFIFALQQFDGWVLGPKILGDKLGVTPLGIIIAILLGGGLWGALGMLLAVPILKSLMILWDEFIENKLKKKEQLEGKVFK